MDKNENHQDPSTFSQFVGSKNRLFPKPKYKQGNNDI